MDLLLKILFDEFGGTLAITRKTANTLATAAGMNTNYAEIEAVVNGDIDATNIEDDAISAAKLASDVVRTNYGLVQHTDGSLYVKTYGLINVGSDGVAWGRAGDMLLSSSVTTPDGFSDVSATYADKFIRVSATALSTGGANTHTHTATTDSHTLTEAEMPAHTHSFYAHPGTGLTCTVRTGDAGSGNSGANDTSSTGGGGGHTHTVTTAAGDNVPAYFTLKMFQHS